MKVTRKHLDYWRERQHMPAWAVTIVGRPRRAVSVHDLIPPDDLAPRFDRHNLIELCRRADDPIGMLRRLAIDYQHPKRSAYARRCLVKLGQARYRHVIVRAAGVRPPAWVWACQEVPT